MIICEVGLNHMGNEEYSHEYVNHLINIKCDAITYQIREEGFYQNERYNRFDLSINHYKSLINRSHESNKKFGIALADHQLISQCEEIGVDFYKVLSWDLNSYDFIDNLLQTNKPLYLSTGMSPIEEIDKFYEKFKDNKLASKNIRLVRFKNRNILIYNLNHTVSTQ